MSTQKQILNEKNLFQKWKMQLKVLSWNTGQDLRQITEAQKDKQSR